METILTPEEVANYLKRPVKTILNFLRDGRITGFKVGREWRILEKDLEAFIDKSRKKSSTGKT